MERRISPGTIPSSSAMLLSSTSDMRRLFSFLTAKTSVPFTHDPQSEISLYAHVFLSKQKSSASLCKRSALPFLKAVLSGLILSRNFDLDNFLAIQITAGLADLMTQHLRVTLWALYESGQSELPRTSMTRSSCL